MFSNGIPYCFYYFFILVSERCSLPFLEGIMSSSSSVSVSDELTEFSSTSNEVTGWMIKKTTIIHSAASSTFVSLVKNKACVGISLSDEVVDLEAEERAERAKKN